MSDHYYDKEQISQHEEREFQVQFDHANLTFKTDSGVFSKRRMDYGSKFLVETILNQEQLSSGQVLELGSGYGPITIALAAAMRQVKFTGVEINQRACALAESNQKINQLTNIQWVGADVLTFETDQHFDLVITNPPIRTGKETIQKFMDKGFSLLKEEGRLYVVIQKKQGAPSMKEYLVKQFGNGIKVKQDKGYWILKTEKNKT